MRGHCVLAIAAGLVATCLPGCNSTGISATASYNPGYGPFDRSGNYVEAWADKPARKHSWAERPAAAPPDPKPAPVVEREAPMLASTAPIRSTPSSASRPSQPARPVVVKPAVSQPPARPPVIAASTSTRPTPVSSPPPRPKPQPKPKPSYASHTVKKGDTLYSLSRNHGTTVAAIQRANGLSGTTIRLGQALKIPK